MHPATVLLSIALSLAAVVGATPTPSGADLTRTSFPQNRILPCPPEWKPYASQYERWQNEMKNTYAQCNPRCQNMNRSRPDCFEYCEDYCVDLGARNSAGIHPVNGKSLPPPPRRSKKPKAKRSVPGSTNDAEGDSEIIRRAPVDSYCMAKCCDQKACDIPSEKTICIKQCEA